MENPSDDYNHSVTMAGAVGQLAVAREDGEKEDIQKPCCSDSQLLIDAIMSSTKHDNYSCRPAEILKSKELDAVEILVTPTESEALEIESAARQLRSGFKGISASDTTVTSGEAHHPFFPADITSNAIYTPFHLHGLQPSVGTKMNKKASYFKGESMPKYLSQPVKKKVVPSGPGNQRLYASNSPYSNTTNSLSVIEEVDEDCENEGS